MYPLYPNTSIYQQNNGNSEDYILRRAEELETEDHIQDSMTFTVEKSKSTYRFVNCQGNLLRKFGCQQSDIEGKDLEECLPTNHTLKKILSSVSAWEGKTITYEEQWNGIPFLGAVTPIYGEEGKVKQLQGFCVDISKKKETENQLKEREYYFRTLFKYHPDGIFTLNKEGKFLFVNPAVLSICGYTENELISSCFIQLSAPEEREKVKDFFDQTRDGKILDFETTVFHKDGHPVKVQVTNIPIIVDDEVHSIYGIIHDITQQKKSEKELHLLKDRLASMIHHSADSIAIFDMDDQLVNANPTFESFYGWKAGELIGKKVPYIPEEYKDEYGQILKEVKKGNKFTSIETTRITKDGSNFYASVTLSPLEDEEGNIIGYSAITRDINKQKIAQEALRKQNEHYRIITEHTMDLINVFRPNGQILYSSPSHKMILGYNAGGFKDMEWTKVIHPEDLGAVIQSIVNMKQTKDSSKIEFRVKNADGNWVVLECYGTVVLNQKNEVESFVTISRDITERKQTEDFLRKSEKLAVLGELAAGIAHEIRNPLTSLKGFTHLLKANAADENLEYYDIMLSELERINTIVGEFMMLAKPQPRNVKPNDISKILKEATSLLEAQANLYNIQLLLDFDSVLIVNCEADQMKQVFINLMKNAIESMESSGGLLVIRTISYKDSVTISFIDEGCGIPEEKLSNVGEPFYTTKEKGTGLGMMICNKIIENHHGSISIESELDKGTKVTITLPLSLKAESP
ncbi:PAS domain-containing sensor histidine kinase [Pseudalkalibacillus salsuginis]|uniref:PAS domain-containing sensor histidine kinase n=1 Tax=Pseudalkalibacillus salsuginis TaxID=2910972 RepID=UPI001F412785|nr:PAS domain-containing sensor histidine kinase [Pseudalkalibacillus salsuginis]MCF6410916.1 PAS domain S-box protein [Pseudalkalibacillus salsuginis]